MKGQMGNASQTTMASAIHLPAIMRLIGALLFALFLSAAVAQQSAEPSADERLNGLTVILDRIAAALSRQGLSNDDLKSLAAETIDAGSQAHVIALAHDSVVSDLRARLDQLRPDADLPVAKIPAEGATGDAATPAQAMPGRPDSPADTFCMFVPCHRGQMYDPLQHSSRHSPLTH